MTTRTSSEKITEAADLDGRVCGIEHAQQGEVYSCLTCEQDLLVKRGATRRWHYAHRPNADPCVPAPLRFLKRGESAVVEGIARAVNLKQGSYKAGYRCGDCGGLVTTEIADPWTQTSVLAAADNSGTSVISVELPDRDRFLLLLLAQDAPMPRALPEPPPTLALTRRVDSPDEAHELRKMFVGDPHPSIRPSLPECDLCAAAQRYSSLVDATRQWAEKLWRSEGETITPWAADRANRPMYSRVRRRVFAAALIVAQLGFKQTEQKPWLFVYPKTPLKTIFVDFGASNKRVLWKDASARVYSSMRFEASNEQILDTLGKSEEALALRLRQLGVNAKSRVNEEVEEIESFRSVDFDTLNDLVDAIDDDDRPAE